MKEHWRPVMISGGKYADRYEVSNLGRVRASPDSRIAGSKPGRILSQSLGDKGYPQVYLWHSLRQHTVKVARLVAVAFLGPRRAGMTVNHIDRNKTNNRLDNLEYISNKENIRHSLRRYLVSRQFMSLPEAVDRYGGKGVTLDSAHRRISRLGWRFIDAVTLPIGHTGRPTNAAIAARKAKSSARPKR